MKILRVIGICFILLGAFITINDNNTKHTSQNKDDASNIQNSLKESIKDKDFEEIKEEMQKEYEESVKKMQEDPEGWQEDFEKKYEETKKQIEETRKEMGLE